jgi:hypothetical protein
LFSTLKVKMRSNFVLCEPDEICRFFPKSKKKIIGSRNHPIRLNILSKKKYKGDQFAHQKINEILFSSNLFKNEDFFKILKTNDYLNYLEKLVEQHFSKTRFDAPESAKNTFSVTSPKLKILIKNVLLYRKRSRE